LKRLQVNLPVEPGEETLKKVEVPEGETAAKKFFWNHMLSCSRLLYRKVHPKAGYQVKSQSPDARTAASPSTLLLRNFLR